MAVKNSFGSSITLTLFGESHGLAVGAVLDGLCPGMPVDEETIAALLSRRRPSSGTDTARREPDAFQLVSGVWQGKTTGTPLCILIPNQEQHSGDYAALLGKARPAHADFAAYCKYHGYEDARGGGHFSGRLTAPLCFAGGIAKQYLRGFGIEVGAHIASIGSVQDKPFDPVSIEPDTLLAVQEKFFPVLDDKAGERMQKLIEHCRDQLDSVGGVIECAIAGVPAGIGDPMFDCVESKISSLLFGIPAVKGVEFGLGFGLSSLQGSQANDPFYIRENAASSKEVLTATNHNGGILGGITDGMPVIFRAAIKPTPSIAQKQRTVNFKTGENVELSITGRHDPCIVRRAVPCIESAAAIALMDLMLGSDLVPKNPSRKGGSTR